MRKTAQGRFSHPGRALQPHEERDGPANRYFDYDEWGTPERPYAQDGGGEVSIDLSSEIATQAVRISACFV